ncbi:MAG: O-antigen acetylase [Bryobacterales bacterium]|nr:O-antigen acetylase [Bryobacterales bacterium]
MSDDIKTPAFSVHLDAIRGVAALVVFLAHGRNMFFGNVQGTDASPGSLPAAVGAIPDTISAPSVSPAALGIGHHAVIVFFVLSGYLVGTSVVRSIHEGRWSWRKYLEQRLTRLWMVLIPALLIGLCLDTTGVRLFGPQSLYGAPRGQSVIQHPVSERLNVLTLVENAAFVQTIAGPEFGTNVALWSLANEFWYYIAFPLLALALWRGGFSRMACLLSTVVLFWFVGSSIALYFSVWILGVGLSYVPRIPNRMSRAIALMAATLFLLTSAYVRRHPFSSQYASDFVLALLCCAVLYGCLHERQPMRPGLYSRVAQSLSKVSYSLYLVHLPALVFLNAAFQSVWHRWPKDSQHILAFAALSGGVLVCAYVFYVLFERNTDRVREAISGLHRRPAETAPEVFA